MEHEQTTIPLTGTNDLNVKPRNSDNAGPPKWRSCRFVLAYMVLWGNAVIFLQRISFSMVIVCMVNHTALDLMAVHGSGLDKAEINMSDAVLDLWTYVGNTSREDMNGSESIPGLDHAGWTTVKYWDSPLTHPALHNTTRETGGSKGEGMEGSGCNRPRDASGSEEKEDGPFVWSKDTQGILLGAVYWGYMTTQILAGHLFFLFGPRRVCVVNMAAMAVLTMLCHPAAHASPWLVFALRVAIGVCTSFAIPSMYAIWGKWAPTKERATLMSLSFSGQNVANSIVFPVSALLCKYGFAGGWPSVFYVNGLFGILWCLVWMVVVSDSPETSRWISPEERDYILAHRGEVTSKGEKIQVPWCAIFTSSCFWAIVVGHVTFTWGLFLFLSNLPLYMYEVMKFDIKSNGFFSMLPYIALGAVQMSGGFLTDLVIRRQIFNVYWARRVATATASLLPAACLVALSYLDCTQVGMVMSLLVVGVGFTGFAFSGFFINPFDIAPRYAISIASVSNSLACLPGIVTPYLVAEVTKDKTREQWQIIFFITGGVYVCGTIFFFIFARTSVQEWGIPPSHLTHVETDSFQKLNQADLQEKKGESEEIQGEKGEGDISHTETGAERGLLIHRAKDEVIPQEKCQMANGLGTENV